MRKHTPVGRLCTLFVLLLVAGPLHASSSWRVELLVFERPHGQGHNAEFWATGFESTLATRLERRLAGGRNPVPAVAAGTALANEARALEREGHRILCQSAWQQPTYGPSRAMPIRRCAEAGDALSVHASLAIALQPVLTLEIARRSEQPTALPSPDEGPFAPVSQTVYYMIEETRGQRPGELHYYDHPVIGALVRITEIRQ